MVLFVSEYSHGPVQLLGKKQPNHLMGKSHVGKGKLAIGTLINLLGETKSAAYLENDTFVGLL